MKQLKKYALIFVLAVLLHETKAQDATSAAFSLQQAIEYGKKNSPNYLNAELDLKNADYKRKEITGMGLPQVTGSLDLKDYINLPTSLLPAKITNPAAGPNDFVPIKFGTKYNATAGISASETISSDYFFGLSAQREFMNLSKISVTRSMSDLVAQITKAYYTVVISRARMRSLDANIAKLKKAFDDTRAANKQGLVEMIDVERLEVQYNNLTSEREKTDKMIGLSETVLKFQMGYKLDSPIVLSDSLNAGSESFQDLNGGKIDISQRPDYKMMQAQQALYDIDIRRQKFAFLPTLTAYGSIQYNAQRNTFTIFQASGSDVTKSWYNISLIGATMNFNFFTSWQRMNRLEQAKITSLKGQNSIKTLQLAAELEATTANINYNNAYTTLTRQKKNMELAQHVYDVAQKKYESGIGSNIEVVTAQTSLTESQTNYYSAVYDMIVAKTDYLKATGTLVK